MKRGLFTHNSRREETATCPKCGRVLQTISRGSMTFSRGEVDDNIEFGYVCPNGDYEEWESDYAKVGA